MKRILLIITTIISLTSCEGFAPSISIQTDPVTGKITTSASATYNYIPRPIPNPTK